MLLPASCLLLELSFDLLTVTLLVWTHFIAFALSAAFPGGERFTANGSTVSGVPETVDSPKTETKRTIRNNLI